MQCPTGSETMIARDCRRKHDTDSRSCDNVALHTMSHSGVCYSVCNVGGDGAKGQTERETEETETRTETHCIEQMENQEQSTYVYCTQFCSWHSGCIVWCDLCGYMPGGRWCGRDGESRGEGWW